MTTIRRLYMITSIVHLQHLSVFSPKQRYEQTIETIHSVRAKDPNGIIVVIESSPILEESRVVFDGVHMYYIKNPSRIFAIGKSQGECEILKEFMTSDMYNSFKNNIDIVIKLSGRYRITDDANIQQLDKKKITVRRVYFPHVVNPDKSACITILFSFPIDMTDFILERLDIAKNRCNTQLGYDIEQSIFYGVDDSKMKYIEYIGVTGYQAPDGALKIY